MSFSQFPWENRVFRVDRECYLLFLGMDELDEKPFVRIGNSSWLDKRVLEVISHTVITESFTGNPFSEVGLTHHYHGLYLGEPKIVEVIKSFFDRFKVKEQEIITYAEQEEREGRDHVYFYNTGNIVVTFDKTRLFDLYAREKSDRHYNYYCAEILNIFRKNPLKWEKEDLRGKGFFLTDESLFFHDNSRLLGLKWDKNYFKLLARAGWDPDKLEGILVTLKQDEMEGDKSAGITNFIKRGIKAKNPMTFFSTDKTFSNKIEPLFEYVRSRSVPIKFNDISQKGQFEWHGSKGEWDESSYKFTITPDITTSLGTDGTLILDYHGVERRCTPLKNVPSHIHSDHVTPQELEKRYVGDVSQALLRTELNGNAARFVREVSLITRSIREGIDEHKDHLNLPQEKQFATLKKIIRDMGREGGERISLLAHNCSELLDLISMEEAGLSGKARELSSLLKKNINSPTGEAEGFLFTANYYEKGCFYLPYKLEISPSDRSKATEMHEAFIQCDKKEVEFFFSERVRLESILGSLDDGTLWEEIKKVESQNALPLNSASRESTLIEKDKNVAATSPDMGKTEKKGSSSQKRKGKWRWLILLLILLLSGLLFIGIDYALKGDQSLIHRITDSSEKSPGNRLSRIFGGNTKGNPVQEEIDGQTVISDKEVGDENPQEQDKDINGMDSEGTSEGKNVTTLSDTDTAIIPGEKESDDPQIVFKDDNNTKVLKPFVMDDDFLENFIIDGISISMADIHLKANQIAVMNGYRDLGFNKVTGKDPTIIEPGLVLKIPGDLTYTVRVQDNIWYIAARLLESELREHSERFNELTDIYENLVAKGETGEKELRNIEILEKESNCENFRIKVQNWLITSQNQ